MRRKTPYPAVFANIVATMAEALIADAGHNKVAYLDDYTATTLSWLGTAGSGPGQWRAPRAVTSCGAGFLIADTGNHRIVSIDGADGSGWQALGNHGTAQGQFDQPTGLAVDSEGRIYIADSGNARVVRVDGIDGSGWVSFGTAGAPTPTDPAVGKFRQPTGLAVDGNDDLWIADWECSRVVKIAGMDGTGWFAVRVDSPVAIAADDDNAAVLVASIGAKRISRHDAATGDLVAATPANTLAAPAAVQILDATIVALDAAARRLMTIDDALGQAITQVHLADLDVRRPLGMVVW